MSGCNTVERNLRIAALVSRIIHAQSVLPLHLFVSTFQKRSTIKFSTTPRLECVVGFVVGMYKCESPCPSLPRIS